MKKELVDQVLAGLIDFVKDASAFAHDQIPDVVKQLITYTIASDVM